MFISDESTSLISLVVTADLGIFEREERSMVPLSRWGQWSATGLDDPYTSCQLSWSLATR